MYGAGSIWRATTALPDFYPVKALSYDHQFEFLCYPKDREAIIGKENVVGLSGSAYNTESNFVSNPDKKEPCFFFENPHTLGMEMIHASWVAKDRPLHSRQRVAGHRRDSNARARRLRVLHRDAQKRIASTFGMCCLHAEAGSRMQKPLRPSIGCFGPEGRRAFGQGQRADNAQQRKMAKSQRTACKEEQKRMPTKGEPVKTKKGDSDEEAEDPPKKKQKVSTTDKAKAKKKKADSDVGTCSEWSASEGEDE